jgi:hypothetical protein
MTFSHNFSNALKSKISNTDSKVISIKYLVNSNSRPREIETDWWNNKRKIALACRESKHRKNNIRL